MIMTMIIIRIIIITKTERNAIFALFFLFPYLSMSKTMFATNVCVYDCFCLWPLFLCSLLCLHVITAMSMNMMICVMTTIVKIYDSVYVYAYQHVHNCMCLYPSLYICLSICL